MSASERPKRRFHEQLETLQDRLMEMAGRAEELVGVAVDGLLRQDASVADRVRAEDDGIDSIEIEIDERVMELLALQQPMATDLRRIFTTLKISNDLERVGDHAVNIAKAAARLSDAAPLPEMREIREMARIARGMLADALAAWSAEEPGTARMVCATDDEVDDLRSSLYRIVVTHMLEEPRRITAGLEILLVAQNLERIADLATNIAEDVVFLVEGETIKHHSDTHHSDEHHADEHRADSDDA